MTSDKESAGDRNLISISKHTSQPPTAQSLGALLKSARDIMRKDKGHNQKSEGRSQKSEI